MGVSPTRLEPPLTKAALSPRPRLCGPMDQILHSRLTVLLAPAGYGKTCLLTQWYHAAQEQGIEPAWLTAAASQSGIDFLQRFVGAAQTSAAPALLFIDDVQLLPQEALTALDELIQDAPAQARFVVASRELPKLRLALARVRGQLRELHADDLTFSLDEARAFLTDSLGGALDDDIVAALHARSEGWIAALKLAVLELQRGTPASAVLESLTGSNRAIADFFAEEVLSQQPAEVREFLLKTAILDNLHPALCDAVTRGDDACRILDRIERNGLFVQRRAEALDSYRYHPLFAEFLRRQLAENGPNLARELHLRASQWFCANGAHLEAIEHALKGAQPERAAELLEGRCQELTYTGEIRLVIKFSEQIPTEILDRYPALLLTLAWRQARALRFKEAAELLAAARTRLEEIQSSKALTARELRRLSYLVLHREMVLAAGYDDVHEIEACCQRLLRDYPEENHPYLKGTIYGHLLETHREQFKLKELDRVWADCEGLISRSSYSGAAVGLQAIVGHSLSLAGRTDAARRMLEQGFEEGIRCGGPHSFLAAVSALPLAEIAYECNELERADELLAGALPAARDFGFSCQLTLAYLTLARLKNARGDLPQALWVLDEGLRIAMERRLERLRLALTAERVKLLIQSNAPEEAVRFARAAQIPGRSELPLPRGSVTCGDEARALAWVRIARAQDRIKDGLRVAKQWQTFCASHGALRSLVRWEVQIAQLHFHCGQHRPALSCLRDALSRGAGSRLLRTFIDEGPIIRSLLASTYSIEPHSAQPADLLGGELLRILDEGRGRHPAPVQRSESNAPHGKLSMKEREILSLVGSGMRNGEIAEKLGMTLGTVKWYVHQIYDKVGTRSRLGAIERARHAGLIA